MNTGLTVVLHDARQPQPPSGWNSFVAGQPLPSMWQWPMISTVASARRSAVVAATIHDGATVRAIATARLTGVGPRRGGVPLAGVADVDCLTSASVPGIVCDASAGPHLPPAAMVALREALRTRYGRRIHGVLFRQLGEQLLPAVLRWPAIVREGGPIGYFRNTFADFPGYLASLTKSRRWSLRRSISAIEADSDVVISFGLDGADTLRAEEISALNNVIVRRHHRHWWLRKRLMTPEVAATQIGLPGVRWLRYHDTAGRLLAYANMWEHPHESYMGGWGCREVADGGRKDLWFHYNAAVVRWCIEEGRPGFVSGQGSIGEKVRLGHELRRQWSVLVPHRP